MDQTPESGEGFFTSVRRILHAALGLVQNRLQIFTIELQEEKIRLFDLLLRLVAVAVLGCLTLITATALLVVALWNTSPVAVLLIITLVYGGTAAGLGYSIHQRLQRTSFAGTLAEFKKDREWLSKEN